jgi:hypothetical protein
MPILQSTLATYAAQAPLRKSATVVEEARVAKKQTAFLCHSHNDAKLAKGLQAFLQAQEWEVYIDWDDTTMPATPSRETAERIQQRIRQLDWFLFLATSGSVASRWCPWEIGYADGVKVYNSILVIPTRDSAGYTHGNEYLQLYRHIDGAEGGGFGAFKPNQRGVLLREMARP